MNFNPFRIGLDIMRAKASYHRGPADGLDSRIRPMGLIEAILRNKYGEIIQVERTHNLVTDRGDQYFAGLPRVSGAALAFNHMMLGTATTAAAKNGAGAFIGTGDYIAGSMKLTDSASPKQGAAANITQWLRTYAAGEGTSTTVNRVAIVAHSADLTGGGGVGEPDATRTIAIAVFPNTIAKGAADTLSVTWNITWLGA